MSTHLNVQLRDVLESDLPIFYEHQIDPDAARMAAFPSRDREAFMAHWAKIMADETVTLKTVLLDGQVAGNMVCFAQSGEREVGYWLGKEYWGKGIATRALKEFLGLIQMRPLFAHVAKHNIGSKRVLEKCGFAAYGESKGFPDSSGAQVEELVLKLE
jgi:RimJ/RimL family protein N-acetyltransferase